MKTLISFVFVGLLTPFVFAPKLFAQTDADYDAVAERVRSARNSYELLGVKPNADKAEIKAAHAAMAKKILMKANTGDREATDLFQKLNGARDAANQNLGSRPLEQNTQANSKYDRQQNTYSQARSASNQGAGMNEQWKNYYAKMAAARGPNEREALRTVQLQHVETASDFRRIIAANAKPQDPEWNKEVKAFTQKHMDVFMETRPTNGELNNLAGMLQQSDGGQRMVYDMAFKSAKTPADMIRLMKPDVSSMSGTGGKGWIKDITGSLGEHAYRFYLLDPTPQEIQQFEATTRISLEKGTGGKILSDAVAKAAHVKSGKSPESFKAGGVFGAAGGVVKKGFMKAFMGRFMSVDPTIVTGVVRAVIDESEAKSLSAGVCPPGANTTPRVVTSSYMNLFVMMSLEEQQSVLNDCESKSASSKKYLEDARLKLLEQNKDKLDYSKESLVCEKSKITYKNKLNQDVVISFDAKGELSEIEMAPPVPKVSSRVINRPWIGNPNHSLKYKTNGGKPEFEYSAFSYPKGQKVDKPAKAYDSETSFFLRLICLHEICDEQAFTQNTTQRDDSFHSISPDIETRLKAVSNNKPFGEMDTKFLEAAGTDMHRLLGLLRSTANQKPQAEKFCETLKNHVQVETQMASKEEAIPHNATSQEGVDADH